MRPSAVADPHSSASRHPVDEPVYAFLLYATERNRHIFGRDVSSKEQTIGHETAQLEIAIGETVSGLKGSSCDGANRSLGEVENLREWRQGRNDEVHLGVRHQTLAKFQQIRAVRRLQSESGRH